MQPFSNIYDVIVAGAGAAGLTCAALLSQSGLRTLLLDKNTRLGGYAVTYSVKGHRFDIAVQAIGGCDPDGVVYQVLDTLGVLDQVEFLPCRPARVYYFDPNAENQTAPWQQPGTVTALIDNLSGLSPTHRQSVTNCYDIWAGIMTELNTLGENNAQSAAFGFTTRYPLLTKFSGYTLREFCDELDLPPILQKRICARAAYCMLPAEELSLIGFACTEMTYSQNAWMIKGGMGNLSKALAAAHQNHNGHVERNAKVNAILTQNGKITGVRTTTGKTFYAQTVVWAASAAPALTQLLAPPGTLPLRYTKRLQAMRATGSYYIAYYSIPASAAAGLFPNMEISTSLLISGDVPAIDHYYALIPSLVDTSAAPPGRHCLCLSVPIESPVANGTMGKPHYRKFLENAAQERFQSLKGKLNFLFDLGPKQLQLISGNPMGAAYGWAQTPDQSGIRRLNIKTPVPGLYLSGHWSMPGGGIAGVMTSGKLCAQKILNDIKQTQRTQVSEDSDELNEPKKPR